MITVGEVLKKQRENLNKTLEVSSLDTKIQLRFLQSIEENNFNTFDSDVYAQGFIKIYAKYLGLNEDRILAIYRRTMPIQQEKKTLKTKKTQQGKRRLTITARTLAILISILFLVGILGYIGYQIYQFQSPPQILLNSPENESSTENEIVSVNGETDKNTSIFINDSPVEISENYSFQKDITLNPGVNLITILAKKNNTTQESVETIKITYTPTNLDTVEEEDPQIKNIVKLETINSSVWIQLNIDKVNKLSQILQVGETFEYEVLENFSLTTGKIGSTKIYFNQQEINIPTNSNNVGALNCTIIENNQIDCE
jgi:cytoskeletal protein RodZ